MLQIDRPQLEAVAIRLDLGFIALFGSQARMNARPDSDVDLAVMPLRDDVPRSQLDKLLPALRLSAPDLVWLPDSPWLLAWEIARDGALLYEARPGVFDAFRNLAARRRADCQEMWTARDRRFRDRFLQGDWSMNKALVERKLSRLVQYLRELEPVVQENVQTFVDTPTVHYTGERLLELIVECAAAINTEVAQVVANIPPSDYYSSFYSMGRTKWVDQDACNALAELARVRNRLVHQYEDVPLEDLHGKLLASLPLWRRYVTGIQDHLAGV
ncbi:MAG: HepT-like ribonuclease domain-containing protein [Candidatus Xenobia bacterium]